MARGHGQILSDELRPMARANVARRHGDDFQARLFWLKAASLLDPNSPVVKVAYETGPKSFDDIMVEYDPNAAPPDHEGKPIYRRYIQCKWHTTAGTFLGDGAFKSGTQSAAVFGFAFDTLVRLLAPMTPHICEELWERCGHKESIFKTSMPEAVAEYAQADTIHSG